MNDDKSAASQTHHTRERERFKSEYESKRDRNMTEKKTHCLMKHHRIKMIVWRNKGPRKGWNE